MNSHLGRRPATEVIQPAASKFSAVIVIVCVELMFVLADLWRSSAWAVTVVISLDICIKEVVGGVLRLGLPLWTRAFSIRTGWHVA